MSDNMIFFPQGFKNDKEKTKFLNILQSLYLTSFKWENLPKAVDPYLIERALLNYGNLW